MVDPALLEAAFSPERELTGAGGATGLALGDIVGGSEVGDVVIGLVVGDADVGEGEATSIGGEVARMVESVVLLLSIALVGVFVEFISP